MRSQGEAQEAQRMRWAGADDEWIVNLRPCPAQALPLSRLAALYEKQGRRYLLCGCGFECVGADVWVRWQGCEAGP